MSESFSTFRDPLLSLYQSAVSEIAAKIDGDISNLSTSQTRNAVRRSASSTLPALAAEIVQREYHLQGQQHGNIEETTARDLSKFGIARVCAEMALRYMKALALADNKTLEQLRGEFIASTCDPAWLTTLEEYRRYIGPDGNRKPIPYIRAKDIGPNVIEIGSDARIALVADWGTGSIPAMDVLSAISSNKPDIFIHLGDVYYSGTSAEYQSNFLTPVSNIVRKGSPLPIFALSGNHDMYCGGEGFYNAINTLNNPPFRQLASFFCLRSADEKWQLLGLDTGLHDDSPLSVSDAVTRLEDDELDWHCARIREFSGRTILLSHHQLFSAFSPIGIPDAFGGRSPTNPLLLAALRRMTAEKEVAAWFWGHEHTLSIYKPFNGLERGRCLGHGAVPVSILDDIYKPLCNLKEIPGTMEGTHLGTHGNIYNHGYAVLQLAGNNCHARYYEVAPRGSRCVFAEEF
jgi:hypothetical protein